MEMNYFLSNSQKSVSAFWKSLNEINTFVGDNEAIIKMLQNKMLSL